MEFFLNCNLNLSVMVVLTTAADAGWILDGL